MNRILFAVCVVTVALMSYSVVAQGAGQETPEVTNPADRTQLDPKASTDLTRSDKVLVNDAAAQNGNAAAKANAAFEEKFDAYKSSLRDIEKLNVAYQSANEADRAKLNEQLTGEIAHAQSLVNDMVEAAAAAYRFSPNADPRITELLVDVAKYYTVGRQIGPNLSGNPDDPYYPIDGGDQYEKALPIIKLLIDNGAENKQLYVWGFLAAYMTNNYDLADQYMAKAKESGVLQEIASIVQKGKDAHEEAGLMELVLHLVASCDGSYRELWKKEAEIRSAEEKADDLPRVKLTTTKGEITLELFENQAPQSVANFLTLVEQGFYDGSPFHRVLPKFMAQGGAKDDTGGGGPGYSIKCECDRPDARNHFRGSLSMAHAGRDTGSSQFFLTFIPTAHLNGRHTAFGRVIDGIEVLGDLQRRSPQHQANLPPADKILKAEVLRKRDHKYAFDKLPAR